MPEQIIQMPALKMGKAHQLDYPVGFFDLVFSVDVIHHVGDRPAYFREAYRLLKIGGNICTVTDTEEIIRNRKPLLIYFPVYRSGSELDPA